MWAVTADAISSAIDTYADLSYTASNVLLTYDETVEEKTTWSLGHLTTKDKHGPYAVKRIEEHRQTYGLSILSDVRSLQGVIWSSLAAFTSAGEDTASFANLNNAYLGSKLGLESSYASSEEKLAGTGGCIETYEDNEDSVVEFATKFDEAED